MPLWQTGYLAIKHSGRSNGLGALFVALATLVQGYVYWLSTIQLSSDRLIVTNYSTLFVASTSEALYREIENVKLLQPGLLAGIFGFDTLTVETAGTVPNLRLTFVPDGHHWCAYLMQQADQAHVPVTTASA